MRTCRLLLLLIGCGFLRAEMPLQSISLRATGGAAGEEGEVALRVGMVPLQAGTDVGETGRLAVYALPEVRVDSAGVYKGIVRDRLETPPILDVREAYVEGSTDELLLRIGRVLPDMGVNLLVNPANVFPLSFVDPVHPDRMGVWGAQAKVGDWLGAAVYQTQGSVVAEEGVYRFLPEGVAVDRYRYDRDLGATLWLDVHLGNFRLQPFLSRSISETPVLQPLDAAGTRLEAQFEEAEQAGAAMEWVGDQLTLRGEARWQETLSEGGGWWTAVEASRLWNLGVSRLPLEVTPFWAWSDRDEPVSPYERLRKHAAGARVSLGLTVDQT